MSSRLPDITSGESLKCQFASQIYDFIQAEILNLSINQLDFESKHWLWSRWSIRRNLSHVASGDFRWFYGRWGIEQLSDSLPYIPDIDDILNSDYDRRLDETRYWGIEIILGKVRQGLGISQSILNIESHSSLLTKEIILDNNQQMTLFSSAHPRGFYIDKKDSKRVHVTLEATLRHRYFEYITHLHNIQRLKLAQGLTCVVELPHVGYWALPTWDRSIPSNV